MIKLIKILAGLLAVLIVAIIVTISLIDVNKYKDDIIVKVETSTGRDFNIDGELNLALSLIPTIVVENVSLGNTAWGTQEPMLSVGRLEVGVSLIPLLRGTIRVDRLVLNSPQILLETNKEGQGNWVFKPETETKPTKIESPASEQVALPALSIKKVRINNASLTYKDGLSGKTTNLTLAEVIASASGPDDPMQININAVYNATPLQINGSVGSLNLLTQNRNYPLKLTLNVNDAVLEIDGSINKPIQAKGLDFTIAFQADSLDRLSRPFAVELPEFGPLQLSGKFSDTSDGYAVRITELNAGENDLQGDITLKTTTARPAVSAKLTSNRIDLSPFMGKEKEKQDKMFPSEPLPLDGLKAVDADISVAISKILADNIILENANINLQLNNGKLVIKPFSTTIAGGALNSEIMLDGSSGKQALLTINLTIDNLQPGQLPDLTGKITGAVTSLELQGKGSGTSIAEIMAGLDGKLLLQSGAGQLKGKAADTGTSDLFLKIYRMLDPGAQDEEGTEMECMVVNFKINDGIAAIDKGIALATKRMNVLGSGKIDFKTEQLDLGIAPQAREGVGISIGQLAELVRLKGTFMEPKTGVDAKASLKAGVSAGAAVATGGLSILAQGLFDRATADKDPCGTGLGIKTVQKETIEPETPKDTSTSDSPVDSLKKAGSSVKDKFKGLFGK